MIQMPPLTPVICLPPHIRDNQDLTTLQKVEGMVSDQLTQALAKEHGMVVQNVSWEDTARTKNSCWGPNISDMTLQVKDEKGEYHRMPVIRQPNFSDKTHDAPIDCFSVMAGNEKGQETLTRLTLRQYIEGFAQYLHNGSLKGSLFCERDQKVIHSVQACFLPAAKGQEVNFNVALYNYQSYEGNPAVLTIVLSSHGASAQIIDNGKNWGGQMLTFDKNGKSCDFVAERLKDVRGNAGAAVEGSLSKQEEENRKLVIVQIPLKVTPRPMRGYAFQLECASAAWTLSMPKSAHMGGADIDDAQIKIGEENGEFDGLKGIAIERDDQYPIRVTTQLYKITDDGVINRQQMDAIAAEIKKEESIGQHGSSLVLENTNRPTEWVKV